MPSTSDENDASLGRDQSCNGLSIYQFCFPLVLVPRIETKLTKNSAADTTMRHSQDCSNQASAAILTENAQLFALRCCWLRTHSSVLFYSKKTMPVLKVFLLSKFLQTRCFHVHEGLSVLEFSSVATAETEKIDAKFLLKPYNRVANQLLVN